MTKEEIAARKAHVIGACPRIAAIPDDEISQGVRDTVKRTRAAIGAGPAAVPPDYPRLIAKHPAILKAHMDFGTTIFQGQIPPRERELAVLRIGWLCRAPYEWGEHVRIAQRYDVSIEEIAHTKVGSSAPGWTLHESAILRGVEELLNDQSLSDATYAALAITWSEPQMIEYLMMVGHYVATAFVQNSLRVRMEPGNPGLNRCE